MKRCEQELCPMWDGHGCPCRTFDLDPDALPTSGTFEVRSSSREPEVPTVADAPEYIDEDAQGWWHPDDGMGVRADPTGSAQHRRVYVFGLTGGAEVSVSPLMARRIGRALIAAAEYAEPGGSERG